MAIEQLRMSWDELGTGSKAIGEQVVADGFRPDFILGISRGGLLVAGALAYVLGVKNTFTMSVEFYTGVDERLDMPMILPPVPHLVDLHEAHVLIADDVADTGQTLVLVKEWLEGKVADVKIAVLYEKPRSVVQCEYVWERTDRWIVFPWSADDPLETPMAAGAVVRESVSCNRRYAETVLQRRLLSICVVTSAIAVAVLATYRIASGSSDLDYLFWNLALAWVPLVAALALDDVRSTPLSLQLPLLAIWLAFFPNAPYLVTDLIHIDPQDHTAIGILGDAALVSVAPAGLALGFSSLMLVERSVRDRFGGRLALTVAVLSLVLASLGIYLGRVVRLNSWDLLTRPRLVGSVLHQLVLDPLAHPLAVALTIALAVTLSVLYLRFRRLAV